MKKILMTSLVAMFACGAAYADGTVGSVTPLGAGSANNIAATSYVNTNINSQVGLEETARKNADGSLNFNGVANSAANLTDAINAVEGAIADMEEYDDAEIRKMITDESAARVAGDGNLVFSGLAEGSASLTAAVNAIADGLDTVDENLEARIEASSIQTVTGATGAANGQIALTVDGTTTQINVAGLGSAAYTDSSAYATAAQGALADTALQSDDIATAITGTDNTKTAGEKAVKDYVDGQVSTINQTIENINTEIGDLGALAALDTVTTTEITDGTITGADIANATIGADKLNVTGTCAAAMSAAGTTAGNSHCIVALNGDGTAWQYQVVQH